MNNLDYKKSMGILIGVFAVFSIFSCATIREVKKSPGKSGVIMVQEGIGGDARSMAKQKMKENCGTKPPVVIEEGESVVGSKTSVRTYSSESEDKREWRISYKCKSKSKKTAWFDQRFYL